jgi:hypothetical protein
MDNNQPLNKTISVDEKMLLDIYENTHKTKNYMKWQLIITIALVVLPLLAMVFVVPFALKSLTSVYTSSELLQ